MRRCRLSVLLVVFLLGGALSACDSSALPDSVGDDGSAAIASDALPPLWSAAFNPNTGRLEWRPYKVAAAEDGNHVYLPPTGIFNPSTGQVEWHEGDTVIEGRRVLGVSYSGAYNPDTRTVVWKRARVLYGMVLPLECLYDPKRDPRDPLDCRDDVTVLNGKVFAWPWTGVYNPVTNSNKWYRAMASRRDEETGKPAVRPLAAVFNPKLKAPETKKADIEITPEGVTVVLPYRGIYNPVTESVDWQRADYIKIGYATYALKIPFGVFDSSTGRTEWYFEPRR